MTVFLPGDPDFKFYLPLTPEEVTGQCRFASGEWRLYLASGMVLGAVSGVPLCSK